jgi:hypothetical protein
MVLEVEGVVRVKEGGGIPRPVEIMDMLRPGDELIAEKKGKVRLAFTADGRCETMKENSVRVEEQGCQPSGAVLHERVANDKSLSIRKGMKPLGRTPGAVSVLRHGERVSAWPVSPLRGSSIVDDRPLLKWPVVAKASRYRVDMRKADSRELLWSAETTQPTLPYPNDQEPLPRKGRYLWEITPYLATKALPAQDAFFSVMSAEQAQELAPLAPLQMSSDRDVLLVLVRTYDAYRAYGQALETAERLSRTFPHVASFHEIRAAYLDRAGRRDDAEHARWQAKRGMTNSSR